MGKLTDFEKIILSKVQESMDTIIKEQLSGYSSPLKPIIEDALKASEHEIRETVNESLSSIVKTAEFKKSVKEAFRHKISRAMVDKLSGSIDQAVNTIKSDPTLKARMVLAIEDIIKENSNGE